MQFLDDDMDELFRNAASDYPLNTGKGDWEAMQERLQQAESNQQGTAKSGLTGRWWFKPGMFAIMTALLLVTAVKGLYDGERLFSGDGHMALHHTDRRDGQDTHEHAVSSEKQKVTQQYTGDRLTAGNSEQSSVNRKTGNTTVRARVTQDIPISSYPAVRQGITAVNIAPLSIDGIRGTANREILPEVNIVHANNGIRIPVSVRSDSIATVPARKVKQTPAFLKTGLYYGLVASPDITTVKMQRTSNVGYNVGLVAGYRISKRLAVETGVIYERKYYYSTGKYFNTKKTPWPTSMKILDVDGWCNMFELPLNVRYTFAMGAKSSWYVNGGVSSYIMKKQGYNYSYEYYGAYGSRDWVYKTSTKDWLSNVHVGVGYERPLGVLGTLRVEPYVKIPVKGIGVGELPVTSVGMNIGLTRPLRLK
jgi:hypothetical protein